MTAAKRRFMCAMLEKMAASENYCDRIGIRDASTFNGVPVAKDSSTKPETFATDVRCQNNYDGKEDKRT